MSLFRQAKKKRVLVVDDDELFCECIPYFFRDLGCDVVANTSPHEGLKNALHSDWDLVLLDLRMEEMDGVEWLRRFRDTDHGTTVVMITGAAPEDLLKQVQGLNVHAIIEKPVCIDSLVPALDAVINKQHVTRYVGRIKSTNLGYPEEIGARPAEA